MHFEEALRLAEAGRAQAPADDDAVYREAVNQAEAAYEAELPTTPPVPRPVGRPRIHHRPKLPVFRRGDFDDYVERVAVEMVDRTVEGQHWYDLTSEQKNKWRKLARLAVLSVGSVNVQRTLERIRSRQPAAEIDDLVGREIAAGVQLRDRAA